MTKTMKQRVFCFIAIALFLFTSFTIVRAEDDVNTNPITEESVDDTDKGYLSVEELEKKLGEIYAEASTAEEAYQICMASDEISEDQKRLYCSESKPSVLDDGILSLNPEVREVEKGVKYYLKFQNASETATYTSFKITDLGNSLLIFISNTISMLFEWFSKLMAFLVMFVINASSSGVVSNAITNGMITIRDLIFGDVTKAIPLLVIFFFIGLVRRFLNEQAIFSIRSVFMLIWQTLITFLFVLFIVFPGYEVLTHVDNLTNETMAQIVTMMTSDEESSNVSMDMVLKEEAFYVMMEQPFMMRHFGDMSIEGIANRLNISEEEAQQRYDFMLNAPNYASAKKEYNAGNTYVIHNGLTASANVIVSLVMLVHRILIGIVYIVMSLALIFIDIFKGVMIGLTFTALFAFILQEDFRGGKWLANRLVWIFTLITVKVFATFVFKALTTIITSFSRGGIFALLIGDIVLAILVITAWKNKEKIASALKKLQEPISNIMRGDVGVQDIGNGVVTIKDGIINGFSNAKDFFKGDGGEGEEENIESESPTNTVEDDGLGESNEHLEKELEGLEPLEELEPAEDEEVTLNPDGTPIKEEADTELTEELEAPLTKEETEEPEIVSPTEDFDPALSDVPEEKLEELDIEITPPKAQPTTPQGEERQEKDVVEENVIEQPHSGLEVEERPEKTKSEPKETVKEEIREENNISIDDFLKDFED